MRKQFRVSEHILAAAVYAVAIAIGITVCLRVHLHGLTAIDAITACMLWAVFSVFPAVMLSVPVVYQRTDGNKVIPPSRRAYCEGLAKEWIYLHMQDSQWVDEGEELQEMLFLYLFSESQAMWYNPEQPTVGDLWSMIASLSSAERLLVIEYIGVHLIATRCCVARYVGANNSR